MAQNLKPVRNDKPDVAPPSIEAHGVHVIPKLEDRVTEELVFAVVGPVGSGCTKVTETLKKILSRDYGYEVIGRKLSDIVKESAPLINMDAGTALTGAERVAHLQNVGNGLRKAFGHSYLAAKAIEKIAKQREEQGFRAALDGTPVAVKLRRLHIIDSLKHPSELRLLRETYGDIFWQFGVFAPEQVRRDRLTHQEGHKPEDLDSIILHD